MNYLKLAIDRFCSDMQLDNQIQALPERCEANILDLGEFKDILNLPADFLSLFQDNSYLVSLYEFDEIYSINVIQEDPNKTAEYNADSLIICFTFMSNENSEAIISYALSHLQK